MKINSKKNLKGYGSPGMSIILVVLVGIAYLVVLQLEKKSSKEKAKGNIGYMEKRLTELKMNEEELSLKIIDNTQKTEALLKLENQVKKKQLLIKDSVYEVAYTEAKIAETHKKFEDYKERYIAQQREIAIGEKMTLLKIKNGEKYEKAIIRKVSDDGIYIKHKYGTALIKPELLTDVLFDRFQFSAIKKAVAKNSGSGQHLQKNKGAASSYPTELADCLAPLERPTLASAKIALDALKALADTLPLGQKKDVLEMSNSIRSVFSAEHLVTLALKSQKKQELEARQHDKTARDWMQPSAFHPDGRPEHANASILKAEKIRKKSASQVSGNRQKLNDELKKIDAIILDSYENQRMKPVLVLYGVIKAINERSLDSTPFSPTLTEHALTKAREYLANFERWKGEAQEAELALNYEKAFRLYSKARDRKGRIRCSLALAKQLEEQKLYGSACDYYETGNDFASAARLRKEYPELLKKTFAKLDAETIYAKASPACVRIRSLNNNSKGHGSGFFFKKGGYILTNNHVIEGAEKLEVITYDGRKFEPNVLAKTNTPDLAILKIEIKEHEEIKLGSAEHAKIGTPVVLIGFPIADTSTATMNAGMISNTNRVYRNNPCYQLDVSTNKGNSGGPLLMTNGRAIGIHTFGHGHLDIDRFNFAIRVDAIRSFLLKEMGKEYAEN